MTHAMITIVAPLDPARIGAALDLLDRLGNPAGPVLRDRLDVLDGDKGVHFMSLHALKSFTVGRAHLILEFSADGDAGWAIRYIAGAIGTELAEVFSLASDWKNQDIGDYLSGHVIKIGYGIDQNPGLCHAGNPGMTVGRIRAEAALAQRVDALLASQPGGMSALARLEAVRAALGDQPSSLAPGDTAPPFLPVGLPATLIAFALGFFRTYLWPLLVLLAVWVLWAASHYMQVHQPIGWANQILFGLVGLWHGLVSGLKVFLTIVLVLGLVLYLRLRHCEATDLTSDRAPDRDTLHEIIARENAGAQNHMVSVTEIKGGLLRAFTLRLAFFAIATIGPRLYKPGYLGPIGTIHFARWITAPGTRDLIFFSNYGGSWEAYLEDFITLAHNGLTAVWSNTVGFPRTTNLINDGATDGERFKRYARQSMQPTRFWYSAYPDLITDMIRANAENRQGLSGAMTEDEAATWLTAFGSTARPEDRLVTSEIQSLVFGGLGFLPHGALTLWRLPGDVSAARAWLAEILPLVAFNDGRRLKENETDDAIVQVALSARGLAALGLPRDGLDTFPPAFLDDMTTDARARILGDTGADARDYWWWGKQPSDTALLVYGESEDALRQLLRTLAAIAVKHGAVEQHRVEMRKFDPADNFEPFGFADGGSQPVIRGTYKGLKSGDPMHLVEPGEFVLGYPDNRGNLPPGPTLPAAADPYNQLPVLGDGSAFSRTIVNNRRDLGFNGSFLVIRQLEQDPDAFNAYCEAEAERLRPRLGPPYEVTPDFIAAKMVGRWRNGSPLVRAPYSASKTDSIINDNSFLLGAEDSQGRRCPFGAHIRRANPRDSLNPGSMEQVSVSNRHRILRIGRKYEPREGQKPGLLFMCLNGDLERQFEFVQQTWIHGNVISLACPTTLRGEADPLLCTESSAANGFTIPTIDGPVKLGPLQRFITMRGGGYFFLPGKRLLNYLSR